MFPLSTMSRRACGHLFSNLKQMHRSVLCPSSSSTNSINVLSSNNHARNHSLPLPSSFSTNAADVDVAPIKVAFVGLGNMGMQMALNLAKPKVDDDFPPVQLTVHDLQQSNIDSFFQNAEKMEVDSTLMSVTAASDLASIGESNPEFVVTSLPTCEASEAVVGDIVQSLPPASNEKGCVFIDASTISPNVSKTLHQLVTSISSHHQYVDAPVSGGVKGASNATLTFMVGCSSPQTLSAIQPLLQRMGKGIIPCGGPGSGSAVKLCNNLALAAQMLGICEAMNLGESLGVDPSVLAGAMNVSTAKCWSSEVNNPHPVAAKGMGSGASANDYEGGFGAALMLKDLNLAVGVGEEEGLALPVAGLSRDLYRMADLHGCGRKDFGVMLEFLKGVDKQ